MWLSWILAIPVGVLLAYVVAISVAENPDQIGYITGYVVAAFLVAFVVRWLYVRIRPADRRPSFWSPWIVVIAGIAFLLARVGSQAG
jgi:hypothetical protein